MKKNIVYVVGEFPSDTEYFVQNEIEGLQRRGLDISVCALRSAGKHNTTTPVLNRIYYATLFSKENVGAYLWYIFSRRFSFGFFLNTIRGFPAHRLSDRLKAIRLFHIALLFAYRLRGVWVDHIHAHFISMPTSVAMIMAAMMKVRYSISAHAHDIIFGTDIRLKIAGCSVLLVCNLSGKKRIVDKHNINAADAKKIHVVYHGIDSDFWKRHKQRAAISRQHPVRLLSVGRLVEKKGQEYLLRAVRMLTDRKISVLCTIVGDGPLKASLERFISAHHLEDHIFLVGGTCQNEVKKLLEDADIFVLPCVTSGKGDEDGIPNAILEALAMEVPVIATTVGSLSEVVVHQETGLVVPERDPSAIMSAIEEIIQSRDLSLRLGQGGRRLVVDRFNAQCAIEKVQHLVSFL